MAEILITKKLITSFNKIITFNNKYSIMKAFQDKKSFKITSFMHLDIGQDLTI